MNAAAIREQDLAAETVKMRARVVRLGWAALLVLALASASGAWSLYSPRAPGVNKVPITEAMHLQIPTMSTGAHQQLVVTGESAHERNSEIPLLPGALANVRGFTDIPASSDQYATALRCLTQAIYYEAANEPQLGKQAVAQVVLNRVRHPAYPNTVCGVVYEGAHKPVCQFSFTCDGSLLRPPMARQWQESRRVAEAALAGRVASEVGSATHYHADYVLPRWAFTLGKLRQIGAHIFYRFPGRAGSNAVFSDRWAGIERIPALDWQRLQRNLGTAEALIAEAELEVVPGLTVAADVKDRHAGNDVGGRLDTSTGWRLSIPDPVQLSATYRSTVSVQASGEAAVAMARSDGPRELAAVGN